MKDNKIKWLYEIRAVAIICVVVAHMVGRTHHSEWIQFFCISSLSNFVFMMGFTKVLSLNHLFSSEEFKLSRNKWKLINQKTLRDVASFIPEYLLVTIISFGNLFDWNGLFDFFLTFDESAYFLKHFVILTLIGPWVYAGVLVIFDKIGNTWLQLFGFALYFALLFSIIYLPVNFYVGTFIAVYAVGMACSVTDFFKFIDRHIIVGFLLAALFLAIGIPQGSKVFFALEVGDYSYCSPIDIIVGERMAYAPPKPSIMLFSAGVLMSLYLIFYYINKVSARVISSATNILSTIGKCSLDIFLWHKLIRDKLCIPFIESSSIQNIWVQRIIYYSLMIGLPVVVRLLFSKAQKSSGKLFSDSALVHH